jgi:Copper/zinc superoxide dismutase (SODC)
MGILKCTHTISVTALLATAWSFPPPPSLRMRYSGTLAARMSVPSLYCRPRPGFCSSFRSRECLRVSMPSTFMPWASASHARSTRPVRTSIRATRTTVSGHAGDMPNLHIPPSGSLEVELVDTAITIDSVKPNSVFHPDRTAVVIHSGKDDYRTDPAGNAGNRIACGVISQDPTTVGRTLAQ